MPARKIAWLSANISLSMLSTLQKNLLQKNYEFLTNSYESITQATPRPSPPLPVSSARTTRPLHWMVTFSWPPVISGGSVISNSTGEPISMEESARMYTPAALRFPVIPSESPPVSPLWILIGNSSGNRFPVRASSPTVPPLGWPVFRFPSANEADIVRPDLHTRLLEGRRPAFYAHGRLYH